jgi:hypothetical protein
MGRGQKTPPEKLLEVAIEGAKPDVTSAEIAAAIGVPARTVREALAKLAPVIDELRTLQRDQMLSSWQWTYLDTWNKLMTEAEGGTLTPRDRQAYAITLGIATEKSLLLAGYATSRVEVTHDLRIELPGLAARLADVAQAVKRPALALGDGAGDSDGNGHAKGRVEEMRP